MDHLLLLLSLFLSLSNGSFVGSEGGILIETRSCGGMVEEVGLSVHIYSLPTLVVSFDALFLFLGSGKKPQCMSVRLLKPLGPLL